MMTTSLTCVFVAAMNNSASHARIIHDLPKVRTGLMPMLAGVLDSIFHNSFATKPTGSAFAVPAYRLWRFTM